MKRYSKSFKESILKKVFTEDRVETIASIAREAGVERQTLYCWINRAKENTLEKQIKNTFSPEEKLQLVF